MLVKAHLRNLRIAPRKVRLVADLIRNKKIEEAQRILRFTVRGASQPLFKLLKQAEANAKNNFQLNPANLFIFRITVDEGPKLKRWMPRSRGQTYEIQKKTSHITIILDELVKGKQATRVASSSSPTRAEQRVEKNTDVSFDSSRERDSVSGIKKPKIKPETGMLKPKIEKGIRKIFRRKAI